jgi:TRAP-type C4-dicarboxylate transport system permease small subunit
MKETIDKYIGHFLSLLMLVMLISVLWQITTRYFLEISSAVTDELARYLLIWIGTLGAAYVAGKRWHLAIDLLPSKLTGKPKAALEVIINLCIISFALFAMVIGGIRLVYISHLLGQTSAALTLPLGYVYMILPLSGLLIIYYKVDDIFSILKVSAQEEIEAKTTETK